MWLWKLGGDKELEGWVVIDSLITKLNSHGLRFLLDLFTQKRLQHWIESLNGIFEQQWDTLLDAVFDSPGLDLAFLSWLDGLDNIFVHVLDPVVALHLWINHEWPSI
jgi:hypothetical protein